MRISDHFLRAAQPLIGLACGLAFGFGLAVSGMLDPTRVRGFLDVFGRWDPHLAFVLAGAVITAFVGVRLARRLAAPGLAVRFEWPTASHVDTRLVAGAAIFGVGWALSGLCPGPALADLAIGTAPFVTFVTAMVIGMALCGLNRSSGSLRNEQSATHPHIQCRSEP